MPSKKPAGQPPLYDPQAHLDPQQVVFAELYCLCGSIWRQRDPAGVVEPFVRSWLAKHQGAGHGAASKSAAVEERERRKEAVMTAAGRAGEYERKVYDHLDDTCTKPRPWPVFPDQEPADQQLVEQEG